MHTTISHNFCCHYVYICTGPQDYDVNGEAVLVEPRLCCQRVADNALEIAGRIAVLQRGICTFYEKVMCAQNAGAVAVIIGDVNDSPEEHPIKMVHAPTDPAEFGVALIPATFVNYAAYAHMKEKLESLDAYKRIVRANNNAGSGTSGETNLVNTERKTEIESETVYVMQMDRFGNAVRVPKNKSRKKTPPTPLPPAALQGQYETIGQFVPNGFYVQQADSAVESPNADTPQLTKITKNTNNNDDKNSNNNKKNAGNNDDNTNVDDDEDTEGTPAMESETTAEERIQASPEVGVYSFNVTLVGPSRLDTMSDAGYRQNLQFQRQANSPPIKLNANGEGDFRINGTIPT